MKTDYEKLQMQIKFIKNDIRKICSSAHWTSERLKDADNNVPKYFIDQHGVSAKAINEAYFVGRQAGRLDMAQAIIGVIGEPDDVKPIDALDR